METQITNYLIVNYGVLGIVVIVAFVFIKNLLSHYKTREQLMYSELAELKKEYKNYLITSNAQLITTLQENTKAVIDFNQLLSTQNKILIQRYKQRAS